MNEFRKKKEICEAIGCHNWRLVYILNGVCSFENFGGAGYWRMCLCCGKMETRDNLIEDWKDFDEKYEFNIDRKAEQFMFKVWEKILIHHDK